MLLSQLLSHAARKKRLGHRDAHMRAACRMSSAPSPPRHLLQCELVNDRPSSHRHDHPAAKRALRTTHSHHVGHPGTAAGSAPVLLLGRAGEDRPAGLVRPHFAGLAPGSAAPRGLQGGEWFSYPTKGLGEAPQIHMSLLGRAPTAALAGPWSCTEASSAAAALRAPRGAAGSTPT